MSKTQRENILTQASFGSKVWRLATEVMDAFERGQLKGTSQSAKKGPSTGSIKQHHLQPLHHLREDFQVRSIRYSHWTLQCLLPHFSVVSGWTAVYFSRIMEHHLGRSVSFSKMCHCQEKRRVYNSHYTDKYWIHHSSSFSYNSPSGCCFSWVKLCSVESFHNCTHLITEW